MFVNNPFSQEDLCLLEKYPFSVAPLLSFPVAKRSKLLPRITSLPTCYSKFCSLSASLLLFGTQYNDKYRITRSLNIFKMTGSGCEEVELWTWCWFQETIAAIWTHHVLVLIQFWTKTPQTHSFRLTNSLSFFAYSWPLSLTLSCPQELPIFVMTVFIPTII